MTTRPGPVQLAAQHGVRIGGWVAHRDRPAVTIGTLHNAYLSGWDVEQGVVTLLDASTVVIPLMLLLDAAPPQRAQMQRAAARLHERAMALTAQAAQLNARADDLQPRCGACHHHLGRTTSGQLACEQCLTILNEKAPVMTITPNTTAVIAVDAQKGFMPGTEPGYGQLPAPDGDQVAAPLAALAPLARVFAASGDGHTPDHASFQEHGGPWPAHCVTGTPGADIHPLVAAQITDGWTFWKGTEREVDAYSAFAGHTTAGETLAAKLQAAGITTVLVGGLVTNVCVQATVTDALDAGFDVFVVTDACRGIPGGGGLPDPEQALIQMQSAGAQLITTAQLQRMVTR